MLTIPGSVQIAIISSLLSLTNTLGLETLREVFDVSFHHLEHMKQSLWSDIRMRFKNSTVQIPQWEDTQTLHCTLICMNSQQFTIIYFKSDWF